MQRQKKRYYLSNTKLLRNTDIGNLTNSSYILIVPFPDNHKRASVLFANHYLISHGGGFLVIPEKEVPEFKKLLVKYYEGEDISVIAAFMKEGCWKTITS